MIPSSYILPDISDGSKVMMVGRGTADNDIKPSVEKVFTTKELQPAIDTLEELLRHGIIEFSCWMEGIIIERLKMLV